MGIGMLINYGNLSTKWREYKIKIYHRISMSPDDSDPEHQIYCQTNPQDYQQFIIHIPKAKPHDKFNTKSNKKSQKTQTDQIKQSTERLRLIEKICKDVEYSIYQETQEQFCEELIGIINDFFERETKTKDLWYKKLLKEEIKSKGETDQFKLIIPIRVRHHQQPDLTRFLSAFCNKIKQDYDDDSYSNSQSLSCKSDVFNSAHHVNLLYPSHFTSFRSFLLKVYLEQKQKQNFDDIFIGIAPTLTYLSQKQIETIMKALPDLKVILIIPTRQVAYSIMDLRQNSVTIIPYHLFNSKILFQQYFLNCLQNSKIKPYLPPEALNLIYEFDSFPISFKEGCRRLIFCIKSMHYEAQRAKIKVNDLKVKQFVSTVIKPIKKAYKFLFFGADVEKKLKFELMKSVLSPDYKFEGVMLINKKFAKFYESIDFDQESSNKSKNQQILDNLKEQLYKRFSESDSFKKYAEIFHLKKTVSLSPVKKKAELKNLSTPRNKTTSKKASSSIKNLSKTKDKQRDDTIKDEIQKIDQLINEAIQLYHRGFQQIHKSITWEKIGYEKHIKPSIIHELHNQIMNNSDIRDIYGQIYAKSPILMTEIFNSSQKLMKEYSYGEVMFCIKELALYGLINYDNTKLDPIVTTTYFAKAHYYRH